MHLISRILIGQVAPALARTARSGRSERYYVGRRPQDTEVYVVAGTDVDRLEHPDYRGDSAFDWGGLTAGSLELAFAMLAHATGSRPPDPICVIFQAEVVACLDRAGFVLGDGDIALWLLTSSCDRDAPDDEPHRTGRIALPAGRATAARRVGCYHRSPGRHLRARDGQRGAARGL